MAESRFDVVVVGAGILGLATARELLSRRPGTRLAVLDKEPVVGAHQTRHSSGVVHRGVYYAPGSLKAQLCVEGAARLLSYCDERGHPDPSLRQGRRRDRRLRGRTASRSSTAGRSRTACRERS